MTVTTDLTPEQDEVLTRLQHVDASLASLTTARAELVSRARSLGLSEDQLLPAGRR